MLSNFLGLEACTRVFFSFFELKGVSKGTWVSLNGLSRRKLLKAFDSSYYFKVASWEDVLAFFLDNKAATKFPLCWSKEPSSITGVEYWRLSLED